RERLKECQRTKLPGIPRAELLGYLRTCAEASDALYREHSVQHLGLNPRNLLVREHGELQIADFGLAQLFWLPARQAIAQRNSRYAAPELFDQHVSRTCDQYSLALIWCELLTGVHPLRGRAKLDPARPNLGRLPEAERGVIARALDLDPHQRWPSCTERVRAWEASSASGESAAPANPPAPMAGPDEILRLLGDMVHGQGGDTVADVDEASAPEASALESRFQTAISV